MQRSSPYPSFLGIKSKNGILVPDTDKKDYDFFKLPNGLTVLTVSDPNASKSAAAMDVSVGNFNDPWDRPGVAHFLEHMLFLGNQKYPEDGEYKKFLAQHGGSSNASTYMERTTYQFSVDSGFFPQALDRFSQFFVSPLFSDCGTSREVNAVDAEFRRNIMDDSRRAFSLSKAIANPEHPLSKFSTGSIESLSTEAPGGIEATRQAMLTLYNQFYGACNMRLCLIGPQKPVELKELASEYFSEIRESPPNAHEVQPHDNLMSPPFPVERRGKLYRIIPIADRHMMTISFAIPETNVNDPDAVNRELSTGALSLVSRVLESEAKGALKSVLVDAGFATEVYTRVPVNTTNARAFSITVSLSTLGAQNPEAVLDLVDSACVRYFFAGDSSRTESHFEGEAQWHELHRANAELQHLNFRYSSGSSGIKFAVAAAQRLRMYPDPMWLLMDTSNHLPMDLDHDLKVITNCLRVKNSTVMLSSKLNPPRAESEDMSASNVQWMRDKYYDFEYSVEHLPTDLSKTATERYWSNVAEEEAAFIGRESLCNKLTLPPPNRYAPAQLPKGFKEAVVYPDTSLDLGRNPRAKLPCWVKNNGADSAEEVEDSRWDLNLEPLVYNLQLLPNGEVGPLVASEDKTKGIPVVVAPTQNEYHAPRNGVSINLFSSYFQEDPNKLQPYFALDVLPFVFKYALFRDIAPDMDVAGAIAKISVSVDFPRPPSLSLFCWSFTNVLPFLVKDAAKALKRSLLYLTALAHNTPMGDITEEDLHLFKVYFESEKTRLTRYYQNLKIVQPSQRAMGKASMLLSPHTTSDEENEKRLIESLDPVRVLEDLKAFCTNSQARASFTIMGNIDCPETVTRSLCTDLLAGFTEFIPSATAIWGTVKDGVSRESQFNPYFSSTAALVPLRGEDSDAQEPRKIILQHKSARPEEPNSAVVVTFQMAPEDKVCSDTDAACAQFEGLQKLEFDAQFSVALRVLSKLAQQSAFYRLRTQLQLGYIVSVQVGLRGNTPQMLVLVQTTKYRPYEVEEFIEEWLGMFREQIATNEAQNLSNTLGGVHATADERVTSDISRFMQLTKGCSLQNHHCMNFTVDCQRVDMMCESFSDVEELRAKMLWILDEFLMPGAPNRRLVSSRVLSEGHYKEFEESTATGGEDSGKWRRYAGKDSCVLVDSDEACVSFREAKMKPMYGVGLY